MNDKDLRKLEKMMEKVVRQVLDIDYEENETMIPMNVLDEIEDYMGEPILFMGIS